MYICSLKRTESWRQLAIGNTESSDAMRALAKRFHPLIADRCASLSSRDTTVDQENTMQSLVKCRAASRAKSRASLELICGPEAALSHGDVRKHLGLRPHSQNDTVHILPDTSPSSHVKLFAYSTLPTSRCFSVSEKAATRPPVAKRRLLVATSHTRCFASPVPTAKQLSIS